MSKEYCREIADAINQYLIDEEWNFSFDEEDGVFKFNVGSKTKAKQARYVILVKNSSYTVYVYSPIGADAEDKDSLCRIAEFICRANYGLNLGNFELDMRDGEIRFKYSVDCDGGSVPNTEIIRNSILISGFMFDRYINGILNIIFTDITAEEAVKQCEESELL